MNLLRPDAPANSAMWDRAQVTTIHHSSTQDELHEMANKRVEEKRISNPAAKSKKNFTADRSELAERPQAIQILVAAVAERNANRNQHDFNWLSSQMWPKINPAKLT